MSKSLFIDTSNDDKWSSMLNTYSIPHGLGTLEVPVIPNKILTTFIYPVSYTPPWMPCRMLCSSADETNIYVSFDVPVRDSSNTYFVDGSGICIECDSVIY